MISIVWIHRHRDRRTPARMEKMSDRMEKVRSAEADYREQVEAFDLLWDLGAPQEVIEQSCRGCEVALRRWMCRRAQAGIPFPA